MNRKKATEILSYCIQDDLSLDDPVAYIHWDKGNNYICLDGGAFESEGLEAIAWWMKNIK